MSQKKGLLPVHDELPYKYYKILSSSFWNTDEYNFESDKNFMTMITKSQRTLLMKVLAVLYYSDTEVLEELQRSLQQDCRSIEERCYFAIQSANEAVHNDFYSCLAVNFFGNSWDDFLQELHGEFNEKKDRTIRKILGRKSMTIDSFPDENIEKRITFAFLEGVSLMGTFFVMLWMASKGFFPEMTRGNIAIQTDETIHRDYHIERTLELTKDVGISSWKEKIFTISGEILRMEEDLVDYIFDNLDEESSKKQGDEIPRKEEVKEYVRYLRNFIIRKFFPDEQEVCLDLSWKEPEWMTSLNLQKKVNFFEIKGGSYRSFSKENLKYNYNEDF